MTTYSVRILRAGGWTTWTDDMTPRPPHIEDVPFQTCQHEEHGPCFEWRGVHFKAIGFGDTVLQPERKKR